MFNEKEFIEKLSRYEIGLTLNPTNDEVNAIIHYYEQNEDPDGMYGAICDGFILGCMKTKEYIMNLISSAK